LAFLTFCAKFNEVVELTKRRDSSATFNGLCWFFFAFSA
jgi:hypothetical protein